MSDSEASEDQITPQTGEHNVNTDPVLSDDEDGFFEFEYEPKAVFELFADDIYKKDEAGIREPLANSITAVKRAEDEYGISNGGVEVTLKDNGPDGKKVIIQDNGVGISEEVFEEVLLVIGRSLNRDDGKVLGKYGIGFLACYKIGGGSSSGFEMYTRSRRTDEYIKGMWLPGGFDKDVNDELPNPLDEDQYGTRLEFYLRDDITAQHIRDWVEKYSKFARCPVMYTEENATGKTEFEEDYGDISFKDLYNTESEFLKIETETFTAVCSPHATGRTLLLDAPLERNFSGLTKNPWNIDIRIKNENGIVLTGPHKGLAPVTKNEYREMSESRKEKYIPKDKLSDSVLTLPEPIGTRESLEKNDDFWYWLGDKFETEYKDFVNQKVQAIDSFEDILAEEPGEIKLLLKAIDEFSIPENTVENFKSSFESQFEVSLSEWKTQLLFTLKQPVELYRREAGTEENDYTSRAAYKLVLENQAYGGTVYMGVSLNDLKTKIILEDNENNAIIRVGNTDEYKKYENCLNWEKQRDITTNTIDDFDVPTDLKDQLFQKKQFETTSEKKNTSTDTQENTDTKAQRPVEKRTLKIHVSKGAKADYTFTVEDTLSQFNDGSAPFEKLVLFTPNTDTNITDKKWIATDKIALANCTQKMFERLVESESIVHIETLYEEAKNTPINSIQGVTTFSELYAETQTEIYVHPVPEEMYTELSEETVRKEFEMFLAENASEVMIDDPENLVYLPIKEKKFNSTLRPMFDTKEFFKANNTTLIKSIGEDLTIPVSHFELEDPLETYAYVNLPNWQDSQILETISSLHISLAQGGVSLVNNLKSVHNNGKKPESVEVSDFNMVWDVEFETSEGTKSVEEIMDHHFPMFHILPTEYVDIFRTAVVFEYAESFIKDEFLDDYDAVQDASDILYIPVTSIEYEEIQTALPDKTHYIRGEINDIIKQQLTGVSHNLYSDTQLYAYARLQTHSESDIFDQLIQTRVSFSDGGYKLIETLTNTQKR